MKDRLKVFAKWLKEYGENYDTKRVEHNFSYNSENNPDFLSAFANPFFLKKVIAASISPLVSFNADLHSIIPAPD